MTTSTVFTPDQRARGHRRRRALAIEARGRRDRRLTRRQVVALGMILDVWVEVAGAPLAQVAIGVAIGVAPANRPHITADVSRLVALGYLDRDAAPVRYDHDRGRYCRDRANIYRPAASPGVARPLGFPAPPKGTDSGTRPKTPLFALVNRSPSSDAQTLTIDPCRACGRPSGGCPLADPTHCGREVPP